MRTPARRCWPLGAALLAFIWTLPALALDSAPESTKALAGARYRSGATAYSEGRYKDAIDLFLEADRALPSAALSFNIARGYEKLHDDSGALSWYRDYLRRAGSPDDRSEVLARIAELEGRLARKGVQQMTVLSQPPGATVVVDEHPVGVTPWTDELTPGAHRVSLRLRGYGDVTREVMLVRDRALEVEVDLARAPGPETVGALLPAEPRRSDRPNLAPRTRDGSSRSPLSTVGYVTLATGGAALGGAVAFELLRRSAENEAKREETQLAFAERVSAAQDRQAIARILAASGATLVVGGTVLVLVGGSRNREATNLRVACLPSHCGARVTGSF